MDNKKLIQNEGHQGLKNIREHNSKKSPWKIFLPQVLFQLLTQYW